jgi:hypothetical protein
VKEVGLNTCIAEAVVAIRTAVANLFIIDNKLINIIKTT